MSDTNSNAYRVEAEEKRLQAKLLIEEANVLTAQADEIDSTEVVAPVEKQQVTEDKTDTVENKTDKKLFGKK